MRYPQAFVFVKPGTNLPSLENIQVWSQARSVYLPSTSRTNFAMERRIRTMSKLESYLAGPGHRPNREDLFVLHGRVVGSFLTLALGGDLRHVLWVDSAMHMRKLRSLAAMTDLQTEFFYFLRTALGRYEWLQAWLGRETDYGQLSDEPFEKILAAFRVRPALGDLTSMSVVMTGLRRCVRAETRLGIANRIDLQTDERQAA